MDVFRRELEMFLSSFDSFYRWYSSVRMYGSTRIGLFSGVRNQFIATEGRKGTVAVQREIRALCRRWSGHPLVWSRDHTLTRQMHIYLSIYLLFNFFKKKSGTMGRFAGFLFEKSQIGQYEAFLPLAKRCPYPKGFASYDFGLPASHLFCPHPSIPRWQWAGK